MHKLTYILIRILTFPISLLPFRFIHFIGSLLGILAYYVMTKYRKRALSNLTLATGLALTEKEVIRTAKESFQNLAINCLEYPKFARLKKTDKIFVCENPKEAQDLINQGKGIIFFCGHQANWEALFLDGTKRMPGTAIGRPIKNTYLYQFVVSIREKFGGIMIPPKSAFKEGLRALKKGRFMGILGDQGMPESGYSSPFFGRRAYTTTIPALLAYKSKCPIMVASVRREKGVYFIRYSDPIWPKIDRPLEEEIERMMKESLFLLEEQIKKKPGEWLWQHNRWKQETPIHLYYRFRWDSLLIILSKDTIERILPHISTFRTIFPLAFITFFVPESYEKKIPLQDIEILPYAKEADLFIKDYRFKLVFNFTNLNRLKSHFLKQSAFEVLNEGDLRRHAREHLTPGDDLSLILKKALTRPNTLWVKG